jgi:hypothetical protein
MEAHRLSFEKRPKPSEVSWQDCVGVTLEPKGSGLHVLPHSCLLSLTAGPRAIPSALCGLCQPGVLLLQLLLHSGERETRGGQEGLQRGEPACGVWEGTSGPAIGPAVSQLTHQVLGRTAASLP